MVGFGRNDFPTSQNVRFERSDFRCSARTSNINNVLRRSGEAWGGGGGFWRLGLGLLLRQRPGGRRRRAKLVVSLSDQSGPQGEQAPIPEAAWAVVPPETDEDGAAGRENVIGLYSYDKQKW